MATIVVGMLAFIVLSILLLLYGIYTIAPEPHLLNDAWDVCEAPIIRIPIGDSSCSITYTCDSQCWHCEADCEYRDDADDDMVYCKDCGESMPNKSVQVCNVCAQMYY